MARRYPVPPRHIDPDWVDASGFCLHFTKDATLAAGRPPPRLKRCKKTVQSHQPTNKLRQRMAEAQRLAAETPQLPPALSAVSLRTTSSFSFAGQTPSLAKTPVIETIETPRAQTERLRKTSIFSLLEQAQVTQPSTVSESTMRINKKTEFCLDLVEPQKTSETHVNAEIQRKKEEKAAAIDAEEFRLAAFEEVAELLGQLSIGAEKPAPKQPTFIFARKLEVPVADSPTGKEIVNCEDDAIDPKTRTPVYGSRPGSGKPATRPANDKVLWNAGNNGNLRPAEIKRQSQMRFAREEERHQAAQQRRKHLLSDHFEKMREVESKIKSIDERLEKDANLRLRQASWLGVVSVVIPVLASHSWLVKSRARVQAQNIPWTVYARRVKRKLWPAVRRLRLARCHKAWRIWKKYFCFLRLWLFIKSRRRTVQVIIAFLQQKAYEKSVVSAVQKFRRQVTELQRSVRIWVRRERTAMLLGYLQLRQLESQVMELHEGEAPTSAARSAASRDTTESNRLRRRRSPRGSSVGSRSPMPHHSKPSPVPTITLPAAPATPAPGRPGWENATDYLCAHRDILPSTNPVPYVVMREYLLEQARERKATWKAHIRTYIEELAQWKKAQEVRQQFEQAKSNLFAVTLRDADNILRAREITSPPVRPQYRFCLTPTEVQYLLIAAHKRMVQLEEKAHQEFLKQVDGRNDDLAKSLFMEQWRSRLNEASQRHLLADFRVTVFTRFRTDEIPLRFNKEQLWETLRPFGFFSPLEMRRTGRHTGRSVTVDTSASRDGSPQRGLIQSKRYAQQLSDREEVNGSTVVAQNALLNAFRRISVVI
eukprot:TRINITY_DN15650_c0_g1_i1.p1 TRINITY_DN15650_c0_g1~~TRINITY_DN15650_c0_g1_i1.p1  ORF type:complete len:822 (+),score=102.00 TRINITY_DN15650_c0_g1_i1:49-2514(+)